mmetsp:Transcript_27282/g.53189  ORF Transcript_27282/g.53189 Transcript_27282/m.53189 type:complete len:80 (+) Transcript_27282:144-383(+)|eukprot:CAMPEP_0173387502 /NCGR_PEP_ID=MMETSP1356-20130122/9998_1 /TAXON_ID=77927 ORGANISM="Hemiselmis virescens, Strain PCC157" /NCGR_SAMPLE_ID=MMETSP1356 /ASSEMBLY_ACC=CAM_ASM_000847 /LENGTH=79 /DNA_ID=CAMNT_0014344143 /DNA_START=104 /DNA_END=343 /DNA_ORIENTATION=-
MLIDLVAKQAAAAAKPGAAAAPSPAAASSASTACYAKPDQHTSQCHGAMASLGLKVGKDGKLIISDKSRFTASSVPNRV